MLTKDADMRDYSEITGLVQAAKAEIARLERLMDEYSCEERTAERTFIQAKGLKIGSLADLHYASEEFGSLWKEFCAVSEVTAVRAKHNAAYREKKNAEKEISRLERLYY